MKKLIISVMALILSFSASAQRYEEGKHYEVVAEAVTSKPEVREYFSFYCPHCFNLEPLMQELKQELPENANFEKNHVDFMGGASRKVQQLLTVAQLLGEQLGKSDEINGAIFNAIHRQRQVFTSEADIKKVFIASGVDGETFDKALNSFSLKSKANQLRKNQDTLSRAGKLKSVPTVVVNGKYMVLTANLDKSDQKGDYKRLVQYLLTLK